MYTQFSKGNQPDSESYYMPELKKAVWQNFYGSTDSVSHEFKSHFEQTSQQLAVCKSLKSLQSRSAKKKVNMSLNNPIGTFDLEVQIDFGTS
jgi:hypothetical protein